MKLGNVAEEVGFEPTVTCATTVFKTVALIRSATPPARKVLILYRMGAHWSM